MLSKLNQGILMTKLLDYCDKNSYLLSNDIEINDKYTTSNRLHNRKLEISNVDYKKGDINLLRKQTRVLNLDIDTIFRNNYDTTSPTDFVYTLPNNLMNQDYNQVFELINKTISSINSDYKGESLTKNFLGSKIEYFK